MNYKASDVDGSWATNALHETLKEFNTQSTKQTQQMLKLTKVIVLLTLVMLVGLGAQIYLAIWPVAPNGTTSNAPASVRQVPHAPVASSIATPDVQPNPQDGAPKPSSTQSKPGPK